MSMLTSAEAGQESVAHSTGLRGAIVLGVLLLASLLSACGGAGEEAAPPTAPSSTTATAAKPPIALASPTEATDGLLGLHLVDADGETHELATEVAETREQRSVGLSGRESLAADAGMLFVIPVKGSGFWMKDTSIPLTVAFIECGEVVALIDMEPFSLELQNPEEHYNFGLEANQGWFQERGIGVGSRVELPERLLTAVGCI